MCSPGRSICCVLLTLFISAAGLEIFGYDSLKVVCPQGLSECTMKDETSLLPMSSVDVHSLEPHFKLCCLDGGLCSLCLVVDIQLIIQPDGDTEECVTVCYYTPATVSICKKVEFTVDHAALSHQNQVKITVVITEADGFPFSSIVHVCPAQQASRSQKVEAPSLDEVCSMDLSQRVPQCQVPTVSSVINQEMNRVELHFENRNDTLPSMCVQYEENGNCQSWTNETIPLYSVTPCMCLQLWDSDDDWGRRLKLCPFNQTDISDILQKNILDNVSVTVRQSKMNNNGTMLSWNVSAPCRLEGEVWPCGAARSCSKANAFRRLLVEGAWKQNTKGHWVKSGTFENTDPKLSSCVMLKIKDAVLGPYCTHKIGRSHWSLLGIGLMLLLCLTVIMFYFFHNFVKKWVWSWRHGGFVKIVRNGHVVLLSPPDVDDDVSDSVCQLGSLLSSQGFSVSVDQWSRKEQCTLGPLPWLHSQLLKLDSQGGRILLVLTQKAVERTAEWTHWTNDVKMNGKDKELPLLWSPYADTFTASLFIIQADKQLGRAGERFLLVKFDSHPAQSHSRDRRLPEPLQGLPLFQLPSQTQSLLTELTVVEAERGSDKRRQTIPTRGTTDGPRAKTTKGLNQQRASSCKYLGVGNNHEPNPLKNYP
ncbi:uncharacterized protein il17rc [Salarias fasciatus]|uniref:Uncharacterized LOC115387940 n=1 Tax=Salarias fasciatus TaxID=181472 RepID=A0A672GJ10_SALFA|nr:uncharacterized protein LOC115387940 [Salarias fasciatus]